MSEETKQAAPKTADPSPAARPSLSWRLWSKLPAPIRKWSRETIVKRRVAANYKYDMRRYVDASSTLTKEYSRESYRALITMDYHRLEKGMALPEPRLGFGVDVLKRLQRDLPKYISAHGHDDMTDVAFNALREYVGFHAKQGMDFPDLQAFVDSQGRRDGGCESGGTHVLARREVEDATGFDASRFFMSRHSVREFVQAPVEAEKIERAVRHAMESPSVCNRQSWRVHWYRKRERIDQMLSFQDGNRGFGHAVPELLVITSDMSAFTKAGERNQCWVDGGMFSMALVLALHAERLGSCCLNWSVEASRDSAMRASGQIPDNEAVMMMLAVGEIPGELRVAQSPRRPVEHVLRRD